MSDAQRNFAAVLDILQENGVLVTETKHNHHYEDGNYVKFDLTVKVPAFESADFRENEA